MSGQFDVLEGDVLTDYKFTSVFARNGKTEWVKQLNLLNALCNRNGIPIRAAQVVALFRDWRPKEALAHDYPPSQVAVIPVPLWPADEAEAYLQERVRIHQLDTPPPCSDEERWAQPSKWALMMKGRKRAVRLFDEQPEITLTKGQYWEFRPGAYRRCESYCAAAPFCEQWSRDRELAERKQNEPTEQEDVADAAGHLDTGEVCS